MMWIFVLFVVCVAAEGALLGMAVMEKSKIKVIGYSIGLITFIWIAISIGEILNENTCAVTYQAVEQGATIVLPSGMYREAIRYGEKYTLDTSKVVKQ